MTFYWFTSITWNKNNDVLIDSWFLHGLHGFYSLSYAYVSLAEYISSIILSFEYAYAIHYAYGVLSYSHVSLTECISSAV